VRRRLVLFSPGHSEVGGAAARSRLIAQTLARRGWEIRALTRAGSLRRFRWERSPNLVVLEVPGFGRRRLGAALFYLVAVPVGLVWSRRALVLVAIRLASPSTAAAVCALLVRRPFIALTTASGELGDVRYVHSTHSALLRRRLLRRAAFLAAQTETGAVELEALAPRTRIRVIPNPVVDVEPTPLNGRPHALYSGRLAIEKDIGRLLSAWRIISEELPDATLTLVGSGGKHRSIEHELKEIVNSDPVLRKAVRFTGWVEDVGDYLKRADVYVFPSLEEGMSNALLEACPWRRVILASDIPANRAVLGNAFPLLFRAGDTSDLIEKLKRALTNESARSEARRHLAARTRESSIDAVANRLEDLINAAAGRA
jgi:glycosyltransferase involved in cell wall biosynthesis